MKQHTGFVQYDVRGNVTPYYYIYARKTLNKPESIQRESIKTTKR